MSGGAFQYAPRITKAFDPPVKSSAEALDAMLDAMLAAKREQEAQP